MYNNKVSGGKNYIIVMFIGMYYTCTSQIISKDCVYERFSDVYHLVSLQLNTFFSSIVSFGYKTV